MISVINTFDARLATAMATAKIMTLASSTDAIQRVGGSASLHTMQTIYDKKHCRLFNIVYGIRTRSREARCRWYAPAVDTAGTQQHRQTRQPTGMKTTGFTHSYNARHLSYGGKNGRYTLRFTNDDGLVLLTQTWIHCVKNCLP